MTPSLVRMNRTISHIAAAGGLRKKALLAAAVTNCFLHHYLLNQTGTY